MSKIITNYINNENKFNIIGYIDTYSNKKQFLLKNVYNLEKFEKSFNNLEVKLLLPILDQEDNLINNKCNLRKKIL